MNTEVRAEIDLVKARLLISAAIDEIRNVDGLILDSGNGPMRAHARRTLLYIADLLDRAGAEARAAYHTVNGKSDPLKETA